MKKFSILTVLILSVLVFSGCSKKDTTVVNNPDNKNISSQINKETGPIVNTNNIDSEEAISGTMEDMLKQGKSLKCTYSTTEDGTQISATAYFDTQEGRYFTESEIVAPGTVKQVSYMMTDKAASYMWLKDSTSGTKLIIDESGKENSSINDKTISDDKINFKCKIWSVDNAMFIIPREINFIDYTDNFNEVNEANNDIEANLQKYKELGDSMPKN